MPRTGLRALASRPALAAVASAAAALALSGCITRSRTVDVYEKGPVEVYLRSDVRGLSPVEKGFSHPITIAPVRVAHVLSRLDVTHTRDDDERLPAVPTDLLYAVAEGVSEALARAGPDQEVAVRAIRETKRWGIFDHDFLTSFVAYARDGRLHLHLSHHDWEIPRRRDQRLPEPRVGFHPQRFRLRAGEAMQRVDARSVAVDWRDPLFAQPTRTEVLPSGEVERKTILLESPPDEGELPDPAPAPLPDDLSPEQLRALADLEQARREGRITEPEYRERRREILSGP